MWMDLQVAFQRPSHPIRPVNAPINPIYIPSAPMRSSCGRTVAKNTSLHCAAMYASNWKHVRWMDGSGVGGPNRHPAIVRF